MRIAVNVPKIPANTVHAKWGLQKRIVMLRQNVHVLKGADALEQNVLALKNVVATGMVK